MCFNVFFLKKYILAICLSVFMMLMLSSCDETDRVASVLLYDDDSSLTTVSFTMNRASAYRLSDGVPIYGLDVFVRNEGETSISSVEITLISVSPSSAYSEFSTERRSISSVLPGQNVRPDFYWCFRCGEATERRIGNFYVFTFTNQSGGQTINVTYRISYRQDGQLIEREFTAPFSTLSNPPFVD
ncbi:MAG: hypothetical protein LAT67_08890 [Balneolales bacterium]|nr:hypothetical protein [Balneolales bacterium]